MTLDPREVDAYTLPRDPPHARICCVVATPSARPHLSLATGAGLFVALVIPLLTFAAGWMAFGAEQSQARVVSGLVIHWINFAALIAIVAFGERQPPVVGLAHLLPVCIVTVFVTLLYLWRRDLILNMTAHATIDAIGLLVAPMVGHSAR
jgi:hypothetical protein